MNLITTKRCLFIIAFLILTFRSLFGQDLSFSTQEEIDQFDPTITVVTGNVIIGFDFSSTGYITNLDSLANIEIIEGNLVFENCRKLTDFQGLNSLSKIGGELSILNNSKLENLEGLNGIDSILNDFKVQDNYNLIDFEGLEGLSYIGGDFVAIENNSLESIDGLINLKTIIGRFYLWRNPNITLVSGAISIESIGEGLHFNDCDGIVEISGFNSLRNIGGDLSFFSLESLESVSAFENLNSVNRLSVFMCNNLLTLSGFQNLEFVHDGLSISNNDNVQSIPSFDRLKSVGLDFYFGFNDELLNIEGFDSLTTIDGSFTITKNDNLLNVDGFDKVLNVEGDFNIDSNEKLEHVNGFEILANVEGNFAIFENKHLLSIPEFNDLSDIAGRFDIYENVRIVEILGFSSLYNLASNFRILDNSQLQKIIGFNLLDTIHGDLILTGNYNIDMLSGFDSLHKITGNFKINGPHNSVDSGSFNSLEIIGLSLELENSGYSDLSFLSSVDTIGSLLRIYNLNRLRDLDPLESIVHIGFGLTLTDNDSLSNIRGLKNCKRIERSIFIDNNRSLLSLNGLEDVSDNVASLDIKNNERLKNLDGLEGIVSVDAGSVRIINNDSIINLDGLRNVVKIRFDLDIKGNASLINCCGIVQLLSDPDAICRDIEIEDNLSGCNSVLEVIESACSDNYISGRVFFDTNNNKIMDADEFGIQGVKVVSDQYESTKLTGETGKYFFLSPEGIVNNISLDLDDSWELTTDSASYNVIFMEDSLNNNGYDFGLLGFVPVSSQLVLTSGITRCNTTANFDIKILNDGFETKEGRVELTYPSGITYDTSDVEMVTMDSTLYFDFDSLLPYQTLNIDLVLNMLSEQETGRVLKFVGKVYYYNEFGDLELQDIFNYESLLECAYDPNDKRVSPVGVQEENYVLRDRVLQYTVRFQNTGNAPAIDVLIKDTLDTAFDLSSFRVLNSSHSVETSTVDRSVEFMFKDIWLSDSISNEPESHGYISYSIRSNEDIEDYTVVANKAHIIFDFNPPIVTNTTYNTLVEVIPQVVSTGEIQNQILEVFPNPVGEFLNIFLTESEQISVCNYLGQHVNYYKLEKGITEIDVSNLASGVYYLKVKAGGIVKFIKL